MRILTINSGSSSIKFDLYEIENTEEIVLSGRLERIGLRSGLFQIKDTGGKGFINEQIDMPDHQAALGRLFAWLKKNEPNRGLDAVGHRLVHGGPKYTSPHLIDPELIAELNTLTHLAPDHLPHEIKAIQATCQAYPDIPQVACFDTAFHRHMPIQAQMYALPRYYRHQGLVRYGFHGLSYE